ncbi:MAG: V-type ATP synthase subunit E family protein [Thermoplasmata archaeon]
MTLDSIIQMALKQGQDEIRRMQKATGKEVLIILDASAKEVESMMARAKAAAVSEAEQQGIVQISAANMESRKLVLRSKAETLEKVREGAINRMKTLPIIERERILKRLLARARKHIPDGTVQVREEDADILKANLGSYRMGPPARISGGIIIDSLDRKRRLDLSFETLFEDIWEGNFRDISHTLFKEGDK